MRHLLSLNDLKRTEIESIIKQAKIIKKSPGKYKTKLKYKTLLTMFAKPSLRTRLSFEQAMFELGGNTIFYDLKNSPLGKKESIEDTAKVISRYIDVVMARLYDHSDMIKLAKNATIPIINGLTDFSHPCQILGDFLTILEKKKKLKGIKICYLGDGNNNVTHSLMFGCSKLGISLTVICPKNKAFMPSPKVVRETKKDKITISHNVKDVKDSDIVYTDSWMSYHIPEKDLKKRVKVLKPYRVTKKIMNEAKKNAQFMHCLPARRGLEVEAEVIDGPQSIVFDQAENRLHIQKAILLKCLK